jgi:hypothetical protein
MPPQPGPPRRSLSGIHKIRHIIVIMQEIRSFDSYFGTYPGADGLPSGACVPDPLHGGCVSPFPDHEDSNQALSFDAYLRFIEDDFMGGARLDPATDGRPDSRPDIRENASILGSLVSDFNFQQAPRPPLILAPCPPTMLVPEPNSRCTNSVPLHFNLWGDS